VGAISISTGGAVTFTSSGGAAVSFAVGDRMTITAPTPADANLSDIALTLAGTR
jgi:expansin (peptidoglycan-binding protein)